MSSSDMQEMLNDVLDVSQDISKYQNGVSSRSAISCAIVELPPSR